LIYIIFLLRAPYYGRETPRTYRVLASSATRVAGQARLTRASITGEKKTMIHVNNMNHRQHLPWEGQKYTRISMGHSLHWIALHCIALHWTTADYTDLKYTRYYKDTTGRNYWIIPELL